VLKPLVSYCNCANEKDRILRDNLGKAVVYRWVNNINNKTYVGSTVNLTVRLGLRPSIKHLTKHKTPIHNALLKYGFENFTLEILEYCEKGVNPVTREQFFFNLLKPEYNILEQAGSSLGFKHSEETLEFFKNNRKASEETKKNLSLAATGRILTEEAKRKISEARLGIRLSDETRNKISVASKELRGVSVVITNIDTNEVLEFASLTDAGFAIGVSRPAIKKYLDTGKPIKKIWLVVTKNK